MSDGAQAAAGLGPTAAIITIGDEIVEGRVLNENATWLSDELMARGVWPRLVVAVPDVSSMIVDVVRVAADAADLLFVTGGLGFTPDDITRHAVATAFFRDVQIDTEVAQRFRSRNAWADERIAVAAATFPVDAHTAGGHKRRRARFPAAERLRAARGPGRDAIDVPGVEVLGRVRTDPPDGSHRADDGGPHQADARAVRDGPSGGAARVVP